MKINEICVYGMKSKIKAGEGLHKGDYRFFTSSSEVNKFINEKQFTEPGIIMGTGGNATLHYCDEPFSVSTDCLVLFPKMKVTPKYLYYFFKGNFHILQAGFKGAGLKHTSKKYINEISLNHIPDKGEQQQIVKKLDAIEIIIKYKKQQLSEYDQLIKSRFVEMFGQDLKGKSIRLGDLTEVITKGTTPTTLGFNFVNDGINFVKVECITETGKLIKEKMLHINEECNEKLKRSILKKDDILFSIAGAIGRTAIVTDDILPANTNQALSIIRLKKDSGLNVGFLSQVFKTDLIAEQIEKRVNGVAQMNVSLADVGNFEIIRPTIERQNEFAQFVEQVDKLKFAVKQSLNETQQLFDSLMQEYFG